MSKTNYRLESMRQMIMGRYPGVGWKNKCLKMKPSQVVAIFKKMESKGEFLPKKKEEKKSDIPTGEQLTIFDVYGKEILR